MSLVVQTINRPFSPANIYPSSFWLLCFIPTFITKTTTNHYLDAHYSLSEQDTSPYLSLAINYHLKIKRFLLSHLTLLFSTQSTFRERRIIILLNIFCKVVDYNVSHRKLNGYFLVGSLCALGAEQEREVTQVAQSDLLALEQHLSYAVHCHLEDGADVSSRIHTAVRSDVLGKLLDGHHLRCCS